MIDSMRQAKSNLDEIRDKLEFGSEIYIGVVAAIEILHHAIEGAAGESQGQARFLSGDSHGRILSQTGGGYEYTRGEKTLFTASFGSRACTIYNEATEDDLKALVFALAGRLVMNEGDTRAAPSVPRQKSFHDASVMETKPGNPLHEGLRARLSDLEDGALLTVEDDHGLILEVEVDPAKGATLATAINTSAGASVPAQGEGWEWVTAKHKDMPVPWRCFSSEEYAKAELFEALAEEKVVGKLSEWEFFRVRRVEAGGGVPEKGGA